MGLEAQCSGRLGEAAGEGKAHLDTSEITFRGPFRVAVPFQSITSLAAVDGTLSVTFAGGVLELDLGAQEAAKWEHRLRNPRTLLDKLGVKPGCRVSTVGVSDEDLVRQIQQRTEDLLVGQPAVASDLIFYRIEEAACLNHLAALVPYLKPNGGIWIISPRGVPGLKDTEIMAAGKAAGLVDVKVVRYSETHTANKYVIPVALRPKVEART